MLYNGVFRRFPDIKFILAHCGGALPVLSGRLVLLGTEEWVPNPNDITRKEIEEQLGRLFVDTAATVKAGLQPALRMVGLENVVFGANCGMPCSTEQTMEEYRKDILDFETRNDIPRGTILANGWKLFPQAAARITANAV
ncbi:hypothetical protein BDV40DRAFT_302336 [Aspergillus tamarii]|uniref:Amidohydrolase-related domain-containing protein n=1 Tax=Aspergillus tamarii TaxID=41984 RepID=A0A5N6UPJ7_ASPTM|nr:hypothetical protein BDV40DRAFT_302336 [Aspergillus tamarii]